MLRTVQSLPQTGLSTLGSGPARFQTKPPACYRASWQLPGPDSHRQATTSLRTKIHHGTTSQCHHRSTGRTIGRDYGPRVSHRRRCWSWGRCWRWWCWRWCGGCRLRRRSDRVRRCRYWLGRVGRVYAAARGETNSGGQCDGRYCDCLVELHWLAFPPVQKSHSSLSAGITLRSVHHGGQSRMTGKSGPNDRAKMTGKAESNVTQRDSQRTRDAAKS